MSPLLLLVTSSLAWAAFDAARKALGRHLAALPLLVALSLGHAALLATWLAVWGGAVPGPGYFPPAAVSIGLNALGNWMFLRAVALSPLSLTVPLLALVPVGSTAMGAWLLGEWPGLRQLAGIAAIVGGAFALQLPAGGEPRALLAALRREPGVPLMVVVAACWALVGPFDKLATQASSPVFHGCVLYAGVAAVLAPWLLRDRSGWQALATPRHWPLLAGSCLIGVVALVTQLTAMTHLLVSLVEAVKRMLGVVLAVATGAMLFREPVGARHLAAIGVMALGLALLLL